MSDIETIAVEVAFALPENQKLIPLLVEPGTTAFQAVEKSGIAQHFPGHEVLSAPMGLFGQAFGTKGLATAEEYALQAGDRVEIYRPLSADPKEARRRRAAKASGGGTP